MTQARLLADLAYWGVDAAFIASVLFPLTGLPHFRMWRFSVRIGFWPWWRSDWGWNLVCFDAVVALALLPSFLRRVFGLAPDTYLFQWIVVISLWQIPAIIIWRVLMIWSAQRRE